jgi:hypothetical protein
MEQKEDETKAKAQQTHCLTRTKAVHQTSEQSRWYDQIQINLQQPHGFSNAQANIEGGLQSPRRYDPSQTEHRHDSRETCERLHTQQQMPGKDKHQPWGNAALTHRNSQITNKNSSDDEEPIPRQNRDNGYPASSRDNPLTARRDDSSDDDHKPDPSYGLKLEEGNGKLSQRSPKPTTCLRGTTATTTTPRTKPHIDKQPCVWGALERKNTQPLIQKILQTRGSQHTGIHPQVTIRQPTNNR